jgi:thymidylate kinase
MFSVALVGSDGAGKSSVTERLEAALRPRRVRTIYMGVNLDASNVLLPTTRLAMQIKRARGKRADMTMNASPVTAPPNTLTAAKRNIKGAARLVMWMAEEWFRQGLAVWYARDGSIIVFDRHFVADYVRTSDTAERSSWSARLHELALKRLYPTPNLVICLDAPGAVLYARKGEATPEWLEMRRAHYLRLADVVPLFATVDATKPLDEVTADVAALIVSTLEARSS